MLIDFESSGGFANLTLRYHVNTDTLSKAQARELTQLVESSGFFEIQAGSATPRQAEPPDVMSYRLSLSEGGRQKTVSFNDITAPTALRPLLEQLRKLAVEQKLKNK